MRTRLNGIFVGAASPLLLLIACGGRPMKAPPPLPFHETPAVSGSGNVHVYFDATPSMRGFAVPQGENFYRIFIRALVDVANREWPKRSIVFSKFGTEIADIQDGRSAPLNHAFYGGRGFRDTRIDVVADRAAPTDLSLIVTDLFQDESDIGLVTRSLANRYLTQHFAVAVLGIHTQFDGNVFDIETTPGRFLHRGLRPCYVLVLGPPPDVARFVGSLDSALARDGISERHAVAIGLPRIKSFRPESFRSLPTYDAVKNREIASARFDVLDLTDNGSKDPRVYQFRVSSVNGFPARFELSARIEVNQLAGKFRSTVTPTVVAEVFDGKKKFVDSPEALGAIRLTPSEGAARPVDLPKNLSQQYGRGLELHYNGELLTRRLRKDRIYRFEIRLVPDSELPEWVTDWNMPRVSNAGGRPALAKTLNLRRFLNDLWTVGNVDVESLFLYVTTKDPEP